MNTCEGISFVCGFQPRSGEAGDATERVIRSATYGKINGVCPLIAIVRWHHSSQYGSAESQPPGEAQTGL